MVASALSTRIHLAASRAVSRQAEDEAFAVQLAVDTLSRFFSRALVRNGELHAPTLFCAFGATAGFAAQHALRHAGRDDDEMFAIRGPNGESYWFGERLNALLMPDRLESASAFSILAGEAQNLGAAAGDLPDCLELFERVAKSIGTEKFAALALPAHLRPALGPRRIVEMFWPATLAALTRPPQPGCAPLDPAAWPGALALAATVHLGIGALAPADAVRVFMEAAIPMSKIDPCALRLLN